MSEPKTYPEKPLEPAARLLHDGVGYVYALFHPLTAQPFYVGVTVNPTVRCSGHLKSSKTAQTNLRNELESLESMDLQPEMILLEKTNFVDLLARENHYIDYFRDAGFHLVNLKKNSPGARYSRELSELECVEVAEALRAGLSPKEISKKRAISFTLLTAVKKLL